MILYSKILQCICPLSSCSSLVSLHFLLFNDIKSTFLCSQMLPHAAYIVRLIMGYFKNCSLPELRVKIYSIIRTLLMSMGVGKALVLGLRMLFPFSAVQIMSVYFSG